MPANPPEVVNHLNRIVAAVQEQAGVSLKQFRTKRRLTAPRMYIGATFHKRCDRQRDEYRRTRNIRPYTAIVLSSTEDGFVMLDLESFSWLLSEAVKADPAGWARSAHAVKDSDEGTRK